MSKLLLVIFTVELIGRIVSAVGASRINDCLWILINFLPLSVSKTAAQQRKLQVEFLKIRRELNATSSQDEFAKWAKLRRQNDKLLEQLDAEKKGIEASRAKFDNYLTACRLLLIKAPQYFLPFWYGKKPMFWLPYGWFPYYAEWIISFPSAPIGSVSATSWQLACSGLISLLFDFTMLIITMVSMQTEITGPSIKPPQEHKARITVAAPAKAATVDDGRKEKEPNL